MVHAHHERDPGDDVSNMQHYRFHDEKFMQRFPDFRVTPAAEGVENGKVVQKSSSGSGWLIIWLAVDRYDHLPVMAELLSIFVGRAKYQAPVRYLNDVTQSFEGTVKQHLLLLCPSYRTPVVSFPRRQANTSFPRSVSVRFHLPTPNHRVPRYLLRYVPVAQYSLPFIISSYHRPTVITACNYFIEFIVTTPAVQFAGRTVFCGIQLSLFTPCQSLHIAMTIAEHGISKGLPSAEYHFCLCAGSFLPGCSCLVLGPVDGHRRCQHRKAVRGRSAGCRHREILHVECRSE